jgi:hypothetical protein
MVQQAAPAPPAAAIGDPGGLFGNSNYILYTPNGSGGCENLLDVSVTIQVTEDIVFNEVTSGSCTEGIIKGFGFQLNCYSPTGPVVWQQFGIALLGTELNGFINTWASASDSLIAQPFPLLALPSIQLTAPFEMQITLSYDTSGSGNVIGVEWAVNGMKFPADILTLLSASHLPKTDVAPIVALMLTLVGPICGEGVVLSSGAGIFTYSAKSPLTVFTSTSPADDFPSCVAFADTTGETATSAYGPLPPNPPSPSFTQTFTASATTPMIRRKLAGPARR